MVWTLYFLNLVLSYLTDNAVSSFSGILHGAKVMLFTNTGLNPTIFTTVSNLTEANFDGYAQIAITTWGSPLNLTNGGQIVGSTCTFSATDGTVVNQITGYAIVDSGGTNLLAIHVLDTPITIQRAGDGLAVVPSVSLTVNGFGDGSPTT